MISKQHRFHGYGSLTGTYRRGKTVRTATLALKYVLNTKRTRYRAAIVVSRKVSKSAVVRNRIRRRLYELVRQHVPNELPVDMVWTVFGEQVADMPSSELAAMVTKLLEQADITTVSTPVARPSRGIVKP